MLVLSFPNLTSYTKCRIENDSTTHFQAFSVNFSKKLHTNTPANESFYIMLHHHPQVDDYLKSSLKLSSENVFIEIFLSIMTFFSESMRMTFEYR